MYIILASRPNHLSANSAGDICHINKLNDVVMLTT